jgi:hypothetical protein
VSARVFVPLVGANGEAQQLFEAIASEEAPAAHPAQLSAQISELFDFGLYGIGQTAREATVRFIASRRAKLWLSRQNAVVRPWHLRISDLQVGRLSDENARSAGLGLTLAAVCQAFDRPADLVFATGEIKLSTAPGETSVAIGPVGGLRGKLALVGDYLLQHRKALADKTVIVGLPAEAADGRPTKEAEASTLARLEAAAHEAGARLVTIFASSLDDFDPSLGPFALKELVTPKRAAIAAVAALVLAVLIGGWQVLAHAPVDLAFLPLGPDAGANEEAAPQRAHYDAKTDKLELLGPCYDGQRQPLVVGGETLILRVGATDAVPMASVLRAPQFFIASVSKSAEPMLLDAAHFLSLGPKASGSAVLQAAVPVEAVEDEAELFVVATRNPQVSASAVQEGLRQAVKDVKGPAIFTTAATYLSDHLGQTLPFHFNVTNDAHACPS